MNVTVYPSVISGKVRAVSSKSAAHRLLFCAAFADHSTEIFCPDTNADIDATVSCLASLGADIKYEGGSFYVTPVKKVNAASTLDCSESGTTYRFLLPVVASLGKGGELIGHGRLPSRPLSPLYEAIADAGVALSPQGSNPMKIEGKLPSGEYSFRGDVSSQFASGMLLAFAADASVNGNNDASSLTLTGKIESSPYLDLTADILREFGVEIKIEDEPKRRKYSFDCAPRLVSPKKAVTEGDYSSAAFWLAAGAVGKAPVTVTGLKADSRQGDREIIGLLRRFGAAVKEGEYGVTVSPNTLCGIEIDASQIPDLVPILSVVACAARGETLIYNASRLRLKESDRLRTVCNMITSLGGEIYEGEDFLRITGHGKLRGGVIDSANDHRIAMSACIASLICENAVNIPHAECAAKSYPNFYRDAKALGMKMEEYV